ncbi:MAG: NAD-dependent epimerase/dehydratase family protein, partial [Planctomycetota bacterium]
MALTDWPARHGGAFTGRRVLVTGGAGFIGSHLSAALVELGAAVVVLDDLSGSEGNWGNLDGVAVTERVEASVLDEAALGKAMAGCGTVFHQAAMGSVPRSVKMPRRYHEVNTTGTLNVMEAARSAGVGRVVFAASSSAYGDTPTLPKVETMLVAPRSPYAATKVAGEALLRAYANSYADEGGPDTVSLRYFN